ncbi:hypothetical protein SAMN02745116_01955 [Pilibacter termitis]|uniref:Uncharacterized protein n=1 Tax=Pilibacter termitis TaxID=263852 RepID=A0A1T4PWR0_9ENTE|nr:hypothetical protein [Pilibacter termitis]SJZ95806.1 hypothetical protein SAMN02745116_01955 [Pilibacter termitis]
MKSIARSIYLSTSFSLVFVIYYWYSTDSASYNQALWLFPIVLFLLAIVPVLLDYKKNNEIK